MGKRQNKSEELFNEVKKRYLHLLNGGISDNMK